MSECKFLAFTDLHYCPGTFIGDSDQRLACIMKRAEEEKVSFMMQLGDFVHDIGRNGWLADVYRNGRIPAYGALGNHDTDSNTSDEMMKLYRMPAKYYYFDRDGYRFVVLDPNYGMNDGVLMRFEPGKVRSYGYGILPEEQICWLEQTVKESPYPCILLSHQSLERTDGIANRDRVWKIICEANRKRRGSVILCVNGHYHDNACNIINDVCCLDLNSASYHWSDVENHYYPKEYYQKIGLISHCLYYENALSAVITLDGTDRITVKGMQSKFMFDPGEEEILRLDQRRLSYSRICVPYISDYEIDLNKGTVKRI